MSTRRSRTRNRSSDSRSRSGSKSRRSRRERPNRSSTPTKERSTSDWNRHGTALPDWTDLETPKNRRQRDTGDDSFLQRVSTVRFAAVVLLLAGAFTLYVGHVHATKDMLGEVQELRSENQRLHLKRNRLQGEFARKTSPSVIYERARDLGLRESVRYGTTISVE